MPSLLLTIEKQLIKKAKPFSKQPKNVNKSGLSPVQQQQYLVRLGFTAQEMVAMRAEAPTLSWLRVLQQRHLLTVSFENLDMHKHPAAGSDFPKISKKRMAETIDVAVDKIVNQHRGGVCFEVTIAFTALLRSLGYSVRVTLGQVFTKFGTYVPYATHFVPIVSLVDGTEYVVDCGAGQPIREPIPLYPGSVATDSRQTQYTVAENLNILERPDEMFSHVLMYRPGPYDHTPTVSDEANANSTSSTSAFGLVQPRTDGARYTQKELSEQGFLRWYRFYPDGDFDLLATAFEIGSMLIQNTRLTWFTQFTLVSRVTETGVVTLTSKNLTVTANGVVVKIAIEGVEQWRRALKDNFDIVLRN